MGLGGEYGFAVDLIDDNLYLWQVLFAGFDESLLLCMCMCTCSSALESHLGRDLKEYAARYGRPPVCGIARSNSLVIMSTGHRAADALPQGLSPFSAFPARYSPPIQGHQVSSKPSR
jgi:hypothetical protein